MTIPKLSEPVKLPFDEEALRSGNPSQVFDYMVLFVKTLQELLDEITRNLNFAVDLTDGEAVYWGLRGSDGEYPDGTWRRIRVGVNLEDQVRISGEWETRQVRERDIE